MANNHYTILTDVGAAKIANAIRLGEKIEVTELAVGDGGGKLPMPGSSATALVNEWRRAPINTSFVDDQNEAWVVYEQVLPPDVGGHYIREIGLYDAAGDLIAVGNYPEQYKPLLAEGASTTQTVRVVIQVLSSSAVTLKVDPSTVLATRQYVDSKLEAHEKSRNHPYATTTLPGMAELATGTEAKARADKKTVLTPETGGLMLAEHEKAEQAHSAVQIALTEALEKFAGAGTVQAVLAMLGTGALKNIGNAAGDLLSVGDFGVGISPSQRPCHDIDALDLIGRYYARGDWDEYKGNHPFNGGYTLDVTTKGSDNIVQTARPDYTEGFAQRVYRNGWRAWEYFAGATGTLGNAGSGSITIPYYDGKTRRNLIIQLFQRVVAGPGTNLNDSVSHTFDYPVSFPSKCHKMLVSTLNNPDSVTEGSEVSSALNYYGRSTGSIQLVRVRGSNASGKETLILDCLAIGE